LHKEQISDGKFVLVKQRLLDPAVVFAMLGQRSRQKVEATGKQVGQQRETLVERQQGKEAEVAEKLQYLLVVQDERSKVTLVLASLQKSFSFLVA
jgi:hypothetical protein